MLNIIKFCKQFKMYFLPKSFLIMDEIIALSKKVEFLSDDELEKMMLLLGCSKEEINFLPRKKKIKYINHILNKQKNDKRKEKQSMPKNITYSTLPNTSWLENDGV